MLEQLNFRLDSNVVRILGHWLQHVSILFPIRINVDKMGLQTDIGCFKSDQCSRLDSIRDRFSQSLRNQHVRIHMHRTHGQKLFCYASLFTWIIFAMFSHPNSLGIHRHTTTNFVRDTDDTIG